MPEIEPTCSISLSTAREMPSSLIEKELKRLGTDTTQYTSTEMTELFVSHFTPKYDTKIEKHCMDFSMQKYHYECSFGETVFTYCFSDTNQDGTYKFLESTPFKFCDHTWKVKFVRETKNKKVKLGCFLKGDQDDLKVKFNMIMCLTQHDGEKQNRRVKDIYRDSRWTEGWGNHYFERESHCLNKAKLLEVSIDITLFGDPVDVPKLAYNPHVLNTGMVLSKSKQEELGCDLTLTLNDHSTMRVHMALLISHSPVFAAMLTGANYLESLQGEIQIDDFDAKVVHQFINILYTGIVPIESDFNNLFRISDKYKVDTLTKHCLKFCCEKMTIDNCVNMLITYKRFGYLGDEKQKNEIIRFICSHKEDVQETPSFANLKDHPDLLMMLFTRHGRKRKFSQIS